MNVPEELHFVKEVVDQKLNKILRKDADGHQGDRQGESRDVRDPLAEPGDQQPIDGIRGNDTAEQEGQEHPLVYEVLGRNKKDIEPAGRVCEYAPWHTIAHEGSGPVADFGPR